MRRVLTRLGDGLLERLVPKTTATAYQGSGTQRAWFEACYCADAGSPPPYNSYPCQWVGKICDSSTCTACYWISGWCCG
jgi:hypothetical protein